MLLRREGDGATGRGTAGRRVSWLAAAVAAASLLTACSSSPSSRALPTVSTSAHTSAAVKSVPIKVVRHGESALELVPVYIDGHGPYVFVLDTGSSVSSVSKQLVTTLHLPLTGTSSRISGVVTSKKVPLASIRNWKVGTVSLAPDRVIVLSNSLPGGSTVKGLLGSDELSRFGSVTLDFTDDQLRLARP